MNDGTNEAHADPTRQSGLPTDVFVTVSGGVAYVADAPDGVRVHVLDYDDLKCDFGESFRRLSPEARSFYMKTNSDLKSGWL